jgi:hypothetical protein
MVARRFLHLNSLPPLELRRRSNLHVTQHRNIHTSAPYHNYGSHVSIQRINERSQRHRESTNITPSRPTWQHDFIQTTSAIPEDLVSCHCSGALREMVVISVVRG